jgi:hypothetical protein
MSGTSSIEEIAAQTARTYLKMRGPRSSSAALRIIHITDVVSFLLACCSVTAC